MFEQSSYEQQSVDPYPEGPVVFQDYEIKTWELSPRLYKILGVSAVANMLALVVFAQTSLLTMKGCDSPLVGGVCQVLDTVYVGSLLFGTDREYVDAEYDRIDLGDAEITYVDVTGVSPPLSYPEGYFQIANPDEFALLQQGETISDGFIAPGIPGFADVTPLPPPQSSGGLLDTRPNPPKRRADVVDGDLPDSIDEVGVADADTVVRKPGDRRPANANSTPNGTAGTGTDSNSNTAVMFGENGEPLINKRPFVDLAISVNEMLDKNQVKLESAFIVNASGKLTKEGRLDPKSFRYIQAASNDVNMINVVKDSIEAINDSGYLAYLKDLSGKDFNLLLQQDELNISAVVQSEMESETRAKSIKSSLDLAISLAKMKKTSESADQNDKDDLLLLENAKIETDGKKVIIRFVVPKEIALPMIQRKLAEQKAQPAQPNGNAVIRANNNTSKK